MKKVFTLLFVFSVMSLTVAYAQVTDSVEKKLGFQPLFNGKNLEGWLDPNKQYEVIDGGIIRSNPKGIGNLYTEKRYPNFIFRFDFKLTPNGNNGVGIRAELEGEPPLMTGEIQILDDSGSDYTKLEPYQYHGSLYGVVAAKRGSLKPVGEWNREEIVCDGTHIKVTVNDKVIVDSKIDEIKEFPDNREHPDLLKNDGHIAFLGHLSEVFFKNLRILPLTHYGQSHKIAVKEKELKEKK
jgi:hypothetical protein